MRRFGLTLTLFAFLVTYLSAQDQPARPDQKDAPAIDDKKPAGVDEKKPGDAKKPDDEPQTPQGSSPNRTKEIIERLNKNLESAEDRLDKKDPGKDTREIQEDIIKDLDELLKQQQNQKGGGASSKTVRRMTKSSQSTKISKTAQQQPKNKSEDKKPSETPDQAKTDKEKADEQLAKAGNTKSQPNASGEAVKKGNQTQKDSSTVADLFRDVWGHLPQTKRQEMDAYSKERFMPKYDDLLRQYYRTIAEQGKQSSGD